MRRAEIDGRGAPVEDAVTAAHDRLIVKGIAEADARREVVSVLWTTARVQIVVEQQRVWITHGRARQLLQVKAQSKVERQLRRHAPVVLRKRGVVGAIRIGRRAGRALAGESLRVGGGRGSGGRVEVGGEGIVTVGVGRRRERAACGNRHRTGPESIRAAEEAGEEVEDAIEVEVHAELEGAAATHVREIVYELGPLDGRFARAEIITTDIQVNAADIEDRLHVFAVGLAWLAVARKLEAKLVDERGRDG